MEFDNIWMLEAPQDGHLAVDLGQSTWVLPKALSSDELDRYLNLPILFPAQLDFAEFSFAESLPENIFTKSRLFSSSWISCTGRIILPASRSCPADVFSGHVVHDR